MSDADNDLTGLVYGDYKVLKYAGRERWLMRCKCGEMRTVAGWCIRDGVARKTCHRLLSPDAVKEEHAIITRKPAVKSDKPTLTPREKEIAQLVAQGLFNKEIGRQLGVSERTIQAHLGHIFDKFDFNNRIELAMMVVQSQLNIEATQ